MNKELLVKLSSLQTGQSFQFITPEIGQEGEFTELDLKVWLVLHHTPNTTIYTSREGGFHMTPKTRSVEFIDMSKYRTDLVDEALPLMIKIYNIDHDSMVSRSIERYLRRGGEVERFIVENYKLKYVIKHLDESLHRELVKWVQEYQKDKK